MAFYRILSALKALCGKSDMPDKSEWPDKGRAAPHLELGKRGEDFAAAYLRDQGCKILDRNWRHGHLELDLVCRDGDCLVFAEVKTRKSSDFGGPAAAVTPAKRDKLLKCAQYWLKEHGYPNLSARFDVLCLTPCGHTFDVEHYRNAFDFSPPVGSRHSTWQPW